jgi:hypothetical protein
VIGNISAAIGRVKFHAFLLQNPLRSQQVFAATIATERNDMRVLTQQQHIANRVRLPRRDQLVLQRERIRKAHQSQVDNETSIHFEKLIRTQTASNVDL